MASSALHRLVCIAFVVISGVALSSAFSHPDLGLFIHPAFAPPVYVRQNPETFQEDFQAKEKVEAQLQTQGAACELNLTESGPGLHEVRTVARKSFSFYIKPEASFKKLVFKLKLQNIFYVSDKFHSDEDITLRSEDLARSGGEHQWTQVRVENFKFERRGLDRHGIRVSFGNTTLSEVTRDSWFIKGFKGFSVFAEGAAQVLFNCAPSSVEEEPPMRGYMFYSMWVMAGLLIVATFLLASLCVVYVYLRQQRKKERAPVSPIKYPVYEEFDEAVLEKIRQKVEALRSGKTENDADTVVVGYPPRQENMYTLEGSHYTYLEGGVPAEHYYEDIDKDFLQQLRAENMYKNYSTDDNYDQSMHAVGNIYESFPGYEECRPGRGAAAKTSTHYGQRS